MSKSCTFDTMPDETVSYFYMEVTLMNRIETKSILLFLSQRRLLHLKTTLNVKKKKKPLTLKKKILNLKKKKKPLTLKKTIQNLKKSTKLNLRKTALILSKMLLTLTKRKLNLHIVISANPTLNRKLFFRFSFHPLCYPLAPNALKS